MNGILATRLKILRENEVPTGYSLWRWWVKELCADEVLIGYSFFRRGRKWYGVLKWNNPVARSSERKNAWIYKWLAQMLEKIPWNERIRWPGRLVSKTYVWSLQFPWLKSRNLKNSTSLETTRHRISFEFWHKRVCLTSWRIMYN